MGKVIHIDGTGGGSGTGWDGQVEFRSDLPITLGIPIIKSVYLVEKPIKVLGITIYQSGLYMRDSNTGSLSDWRRLNIAVTLYNSDGSLNSDRIVNGTTSRYSITYDELGGYIVNIKGAGPTGDVTSFSMSATGAFFDRTGLAAGSAIRLSLISDEPQIEFTQGQGGGSPFMSIIRAITMTGNWLWLIQNRSGTFAFQDNVLKLKSGIVLPVSFSGNPKKTAPIVFASPMPSSNYAITLSAHTQNNTTFSIDYESRTSTGFVINTHANNINNLIDVTWIASVIGEAE